jgi:hypothetical protein
MKREQHTLKKRKNCDQRSTHRQEPNGTDETRESGARKTPRVYPTDLAVISPPQDVSARCTREKKREGIENPPAD